MKGFTYVLSYSSFIIVHLKLILKKHKNPKNLKLQLKSYTLELRHEKEKKGSRNLLGWCTIDASKSKNTLATPHVFYCQCGSK